MLAIVEVSTGILSSMVLNKEGGVRYAISWTMLKIEVVQVYHEFEFTFELALLLLQVEPLVHAPIVPGTIYARCLSSPIPYMRTDCD